MKDEGAASKLVGAASAARERDKADSSLLCAAGDRVVDLVGHGSECVGARGPG